MSKYEAREDTSMEYVLGCDEFFSPQARVFNSGSRTSVGRRTHIGREE